MRIGVDPSFPPFESIVDDTIVGIDAELARALAARLGLTPTFVTLAYDGLYDGLTVGRYDVIISGMVPDERRTRAFAYSDPYFNAGLVLVAPSGSPLATLDDLDGRSLAVELGADGHVTALDAQRRLPDLVVEPLESAVAALESVHAGRADAALVDHISARLFLTDHAGLTLADPAVSVEPFALVVRIEDEEWLHQLNNALATLLTSPEWTRIVTDGMDGSY